MLDIFGLQGQLPLIVVIGLLLIGGVSVGLKYREEGGAVMFDIAIGVAGILLATIAGPHSPISLFAGGAMILGAGWHFVHSLSNQNVSSV